MAGERRRRAVLCRRQQQQQQQQQQKPPPLPVNCLPDRPPARLPACPPARLPACLPAGTLPCGTTRWWTSCLLRASTAPRGRTWTTGCTRRHPCGGAPPAGRQSGERRWLAGAWPLVCSPSPPVCLPPHKRCCCLLLAGARSGWAMERHAMACEAGSRSKVAGAAAPSAGAGCCCWRAARRSLAAFRAALYTPSLLCKAPLLDVL